MEIPDKMEIRVTGFGGQGVILAGYILGKAASVYDRRHATLIQAYGPEARGSACRTDLSISDEPIDYPHVSRPRLLIALSQDGYEKNRGVLHPEGRLIYDEDLVRPGEGESARLAAGLAVGVPATRLAVEAGNRIMANMVMLGFCVAVTGMLSRWSVEKAIETSVPAGTQETNLAAFEKGCAYGESWVRERSGTLVSQDDTAVCS